MQEKIRLTARMLRSENVTRVTRCKIKEKAESTQTLVCCEQPVPAPKIELTRRLVGVHSSYIVLVSGSQNGQCNAEMLPAGKLCVMQIV